MEVGGRGRGGGSRRCVVSSLVGSYLQEHLCSPNMGEHLEPVWSCGREGRGREYAFSKQTMQ